MIMTYAKILGLILLLTGAFGFVPALTPNGHLFGLFMTDALHNTVHLVLGLVLLGFAFGHNWELTRRVVLLYAMIFGVLTMLGFIVPDGATVLGMHVNRPDDYLHLTITATALMFALPQRYSASR